MFRKLFLFASTVAAAAAGVFLWKKRDELGAEIERIRGERRAGLRRVPSPRHGAPRPSAGGEGGDAEAGPGRVRPGHTGAASPRVNGRVPAGLDAGSDAARVTPLDSEAAPVPGDASGEPARCQAHTRSGQRCSRPAEPGSEYCWQHEPS